MVIVIQKASSGIKAQCMSKDPFYGSPALPDTHTRDLPLDWILDGHCGNDYEAVQAQSP
jgi:hypothetical protein